MFFRINILYNFTTIKEKQKRLWNTNALRIAHSIDDHAYVDVFIKEVKCQGQNVKWLVPLHKI
jgi:hypothetical protein